MPANPAALHKLPSGSRSPVGNDQLGALDMENAVRRLSTHAMLFHRRSD